MPCLILIAGIAAYHNSLAGAFLFDDHTAIRDNPNIRSLWPPWRAMDRPPSVDVAARPLLNLSLALNYALGRLDPRGYHAVNLAIHLGAALLLFGLIRRSLLLERCRARDASAAAPLALATAILWVVHPLTTQSVAYVIQRAESLMGLWMLLTLYALLRAATAQPSRRWHAVSVAACGCGMLTKPVMVAAPLLAFLYDALVVTGSAREAWRRHRRLHLSLMATWGLLLALLPTAARHAESSAGFDVKDLTPWAYAATQPGVVLHYLRLAVWPSPLVFDYDDWPLATTLGRLGPPLLVLGVFLAGACLAARRRPALGFVGLAVFLLLAPTSSVIPIADVAFEHRMYLPLAGVILLAVLGGRAWLARVVRAPTARRVVGVSLVAGLAVVFATMTMRRNEAYHSEVAIWEDTLAKRPHNVRAHTALGLVLAEQGRLNEAMAHDREALRLKPDDGPAHHNLGLALEQAGQFAQAEAEDREALRGKATATRHYNLAHVLAREGKFEDALRHCAEALRLKPEFADADNLLGNVLVARHRDDEARAAYMRALALRPDFAEAHNNLGVLLTRMGTLAEAGDQYQEALRLKPDYAEAHNNLGGLLVQQGRLEEAMAHYREALRLKPDYFEARHNLEVLRPHPNPTSPALQ